MDSQLDPDAIELSEEDPIADALVISEAESLPDTLLDALGGASRIKRDQCDASP